MKVKIGPFINRWTTTSFEDWWLTKRSGSTRWEDGRDSYKETKLDEFVEKVCDHWQTVLNVTINQYLDRKKRKFEVHIDGYDVWNMDSTLSPIILPMLKMLKENKHGSPNVADKDVPKKLRSTSAPAKENDWDTDELWHKRWEWVMDELIWTFEQLADDDNDAQFHKGKIDIQWDPVDKDGNAVPKEDAKLYHMNKGPKDTHVYDRKAHEKHQKRISRGLVLFGTYYQGLWD